MKPESHLSFEEIAQCLTELSRPLEEADLRSRRNLHLAECRPCRDRLRQEMPAALPAAHLIRQSEQPGGLREDPVDALIDTALNALQDASLRAAPQPSKDISKDMPWETFPDAEADNVSGDEDGLSASFACLRREELFSYTREEQDAFDRESVEVHLESCTSCRTAVKMLKAFHRELDAFDFGVLSPSITPDVRVNTGADWQPGRSWLQQIHASVVQSLNFMRLPALSAGFAEEEMQSPYLPLTFADAQLKGSLRRDDETLMLTLEHGHWLPGTLLLLEVSSGGAVTWRRFAAMRKGQKLAHARVRLTREVAAKSSLALAVIEPAHLRADILPELKRSYEMCVTDNPASRAAWLLWCRQALAQPLPPEIVRALEDIVAGGG